MNIIASLPFLSPPPASGAEGASSPGQPQPSTSEGEQAGDFSQMMKELSAAADDSETQPQPPDATPAQTLSAPPALAPGQPATPGGQGGGAGSDPAGLAAMTAVSAAADPRVTAPVDGVAAPSHTASGLSGAINGTAAAAVADPQPGQGAALPALSPPGGAAAAEPGAAPFPAPAGRLPAWPGTATPIGGDQPAPGETDLALSAAIAPRAGPGAAPGQIPLPRGMSGGIRVTPSAPSDPRPGTAGPAAASAALLDPAAPAPDPGTVQDRGQTDRPEGGETPSLPAAPPVGAGSPGAELAAAPSGGARPPLAPAAPDLSAPAGAGPDPAPGGAGGPPVPLAELPHLIRDRIATTSDPQPRSYEVTLNPVELGALTFELRPDGQEVQVILSAERAGTESLLRSMADELAADLRRSGYQDVRLSFAGWGAGEGQGRDGRPQGDTARPDPGDMPSPPAEPAAAYPSTRPAAPGRGGGIYLRL